MMPKSDCRRCQATAESFQSTSLTTYRIEMAEQNKSYVVVLLQVLDRFGGPKKKLETKVKPLNISLTLPIYY